jgi:hypothetical protein
MYGVRHGLSGTGGIAAPRLTAPLRSARTRRRIRHGVLLVLVAGAIAGLVEVLPSSEHALNTPISTTPAQLVPKETPVPPDPAAKAVARKFIETAVLRKDLDWAYDHANADLKGRMTRAEWDTGVIPVVPYPAENAATTAFVMDYSYRTEALYEVELVAGPGTGIRPMLFYIGLKREGGKPTGRWLVSYWQAHYRPPVPYAGF